MPIWLRNFTFQKLSEYYKKQSEEYKKQSGKQTLDKIHKGPNIKKADYTKKASK